MILFYFLKMYLFIGGYLFLFHVYMCMSVHHVCSVPMEEKDRTWITDGCELRYGFWEQNPDPLRKQQILWTAEPSLSPQKLIVFFVFKEV